MAPQSIGRRGKIRRRRFVIGRPLRNGWQPSVARLAVIGLAPALVVGTGVGVLVQNRSDSVGVVEAVSADTPYTFSGFGHGHGRGMGQWGAYGYAQEGWTAERIIAHYYGGTTLGSIDDSMIAVRLTGQDDRATDVEAMHAGAAEALAKAGISWNRTPPASLPLEGGFGLPFTIQGRALAGGSKR